MSALVDTLVLPDLPVLRLRLTLRLLTDARLPAYKGAMLRGGFGYAFQRASCLQECWGRSHECEVTLICPYRWVFETPHPADVAHLHDLRDVPRPFVIEPPDDGRTQYAAGEALEFGLTLIGRGMEHLPYFLFSFEQLGRMGLGRDHTPFRLERVEALRPWQPTGVVVYQDGQVLKSSEPLPSIDAAAIAARAQALPDRVHLRLQTPLRIRERGDILRTFDLPALIRAASWRIDALATFHGSGRWQVDHLRLIDAAQAVTVEQTQIRWLDLQRTSTRQRQTMPQGGIVGMVTLRGVGAELRALLTLGSLVHVGKASTFGHGGLKVEGVPRVERRETQAHLERRVGDEKGNL
jgi:hypothetical protein